MERQKMKHRRQLGLRQGMLGIILLCWVLPVVLIVTLGGVYILDSMTRQYRSDMMRSAQSAAAITGLPDFRSRTRLTTAIIVV